MFGAEAGKFFYLFTYYWIERKPEGNYFTSASSIIDRETGSSTVKAIEHHLVVADTFLGTNYDKEITVNHINHNHFDNSPGNLEYLTYSGNTQGYYQHVREINDGQIPPRQKRRLSEDNPNNEEKELRLNIGIICTTGICQIMKYPQEELETN